MLESDESRPLARSKVRTDESFGMVAHIVSGLLVAACAIMGLSFWQDWFSSIDRIVCTICVFAGLIIALARSNWVAVEDHPRKIAPIIFWTLASLFFLFALSTSRYKLCGIALGFAAAGWCADRIRGESVAHALALGMAFMIPSLVDACKDRGAFRAAESIAIDMTSGLADAVAQSNLRVGNTIEFGHGIADQFSCEGKWDSVVTFMGISFFCIYVYRRSFLAGVITCSLAFVVWMALRGAAWVTLSLIASQPEGTWIEWSVALEVFLFIVGGLFILSLDQLCAMLLEPIPTEFINQDFPLVALCWNWLVGLPALTASVPVRDLQEDVVEELE